MRRLAALLLPLALILSAAARAEEVPRALPGQRDCPVALPEGRPWTEAERGAWASICRGEAAEMDRADATPLPCNPARIEGTVPASRRLSADFLTLVLTRSPYVQVAARPEVYVYCAEVTGDLNLRNEAVPVAFGLFESRVAGEVTLYGASFARSVFFNSSTLAGGVVADGMAVAGDLGFRNGAEIGGPLRLMGVEIGGDLTVSGGSHLTGDLLSDRSGIGGSVFLGGSRFDGALRFQGASIGGNLEADDGLVLAGDLSAGRIAVAGNLFLGQGARYGGNLDFNDAAIGQNVQIAEGAQIAGETLFDRARVGGSFTLSGAGPFRGDVRLGRIAVGNDLSVDGTAFGARLLADGAQVGGAVILAGDSRFQGQVRLLAATVGTHLTLNQRATFEGEVWADNIAVGGNVFLNAGSRFEAGIDLPNARIDGMVFLGDSTFDGRVVFDNAQVGQDFTLSAARVPLPVWGPGARLSLRNAAVGVLSADMQAWHRADGGWLPAELTGLTYGRLGGERSEAADAGPNMADAPTPVLLDWIEKAQADHGQHYDPQPYAQLAQVLEAQGGARAADAVRYARIEHRRTAGDTPAPEKLMLFFSRLFIGYGVYPFRALWWFAALVVAGIFVTRFSDAPQLARPMSRFWYSVETAFPLMDPSESLAQVTHSRRWVEQFFHFQKVAGFILATILVGSLTLLGG